MPFVRRAGGRTLACWTRIETSTDGSGPDPRHGTTLLCSVDRGDGFAAEIEVPKSTRTAWVYDLDHDGSAFVVRYYEDKEGTFLHKWDDTKRFQRRWDGRAFSTATRVSMP